MAASGTHPRRAQLHASARPRLAAEGAVTGPEAHAHCEGGRQGAWRAAVPPTSRALHPALWRAAPPRRVPWSAPPVHQPKK